MAAGNAPHVRLLLACGANPNALEQHDTPLIAAVRTGRYEIVEDLLRAGANPNGRSSAFMNSTPVLFEAARLTGPEPVLGALLQHGADPNLRNGSGETALFWAVQVGSTANVQLLLEHGARPDVRNRAGTTPLDEAQGRNCRALETLLLTRPPQAADTYGASPILARPAAPGSPAR